MKTLSIHHNPFYLLGATTRDNQQAIIEACEEKCLVSDHDKCLKARSELTNPRTRVTAEISWLPGLSPKQALYAIETLSMDPSKIDSSNYPDLARANLYASLIEIHRPDTGVARLVEHVIELAETVDSIDAEEVLRDINEERTVAGFPEIRSIDVVENELSERRKFYKEVVKSCLNNLPTAELVDAMTEIVETTTDNGNISAPVLIDDIVDSYEVEAHEFLNKEADNVTILVAAVREAAPGGEREVKKTLAKLEGVLRNWNKFARPIQLSMKSRGLDHDISRKLAYEIRSLGVDLWNEHRLLDLANNVASLLKDIFAELPEVIDRVSEDISTLDDLRMQRAKSEQDTQKWAREISFSAELGLVIKDRLAISPEGIRYKDKIFPLDSITKVRWGGTRHSVNGIPTGTSYSIYIGTKTDGMSIDMRNGEIYDNFISKLWKAVCVNLVMAMVTDLRNGGKYQFGDALIDDYGVELTRHHLFKSNERVYAKWHRVRGWSADGNYNLKLDGDNKTSASMSFSKDNNVHILSAALDMMFKNGGNRLSYLLD